MELTVLHITDNLEIRLDLKQNILICKWIGYQTAEKLKNSGGVILKLLKKHKCSKVLNDNTEVQGPWHHSSEWTAKEWFPHMIEAGLKHFAWVCSPDFFSQLSAKRAIPEEGVVKAFYSYQDAYEWLVKKVN